MVRALYVKLFGLGEDECRLGRLTRPPRRTLPLSARAHAKGGAVPILSIEIPWDPNITQIGGLLLTWHGLFTAIGIFARGAALALPP